MKAVLCTLILAASTMLHAQTTSVALNIGPAGYNCGAFNPSTYYCWGLPVVSVTNGVLEYSNLWTDETFVDFYAVIPDAKITSIDQIAGGIVEHLSGQGYTGTLTLYFTTQRTSGRYAHTTWIVLPSSTLQIAWQ